MSNPNDIFFGNIPFDVESYELEKFLAEYADITYCHLAHADDGRSKGIAFVRPDDEENARRLLALNGQQFRGRTLRVERARPRERGSVKLGDVFPGEIGRAK